MSKECPNCFYWELKEGELFNRCRFCGYEEDKRESLPLIVEEEILLMRIGEPKETSQSSTGGLMLISVFDKQDKRRNYKGYDFILRPSEFAQNPNKEMHIHILGAEGSMKVKLNPVERDTSQLTNIPPRLERKLLRFVEKHLTEIKQRIKEELEKRNIKVPPF